MNDFSAPPTSRSVIFPADFFSRPATIRLITRWDRAVEWWMAIVLIAREALYRGQLLAGGQALTFEDLEVLHRTTIPREYLEALIKEGWLEEQERGALAIARWSDWYRPPSRTKEAEAERKAAKRAEEKQAREAQLEFWEEASAGSPQESVGVRSCPHPSDPIRSDPTSDPIRSDPIRYAEDPPEGGDGMDDNLLFDFLLGKGKAARDLRVIISSDDCPVSLQNSAYGAEDWIPGDRWHRLEMLTGRDRNLSQAARRDFEQWKVERRLRSRDCPTSNWWPIVGKQLRVPGVELERERIKAVCLEAVTVGRKTPHQVLEAVRRATSVLTREHAAGKIRGDPGNYFDSTLRNELGLPIPSRKRSK